MWMSSACSELESLAARAAAILLPLLRHLRMPVVTTLHTILSDPTREQKLVLQEVIKRSGASYPWPKRVLNSCATFTKRRWTRLI